MARGNHEGSKGLTLNDGPAAGRGWNGCIRQEGFQIAATHGGGDGLRQFRGEKTAVTADHHRSAAQALRGAVGEFLGRGGCHAESTRPREGEHHHTSPPISGHLDC